jgi:nitrogen fixation protein NifU and related proteins
MLGELRELYQEVILDHGKHPRNHRRPADANREAKGYNPMCGDRVTVYLKVDDDGLIRDAAFEGKGCAISQASASMMTEILQGKPAAQAQTLFHAFHELCTRDDYDPAAHPEADQEAMERLAALAGVREFPARVKCATLAWHAMDAALKGGGKASTE